MTEGLCVNMQPIYVSQDDQLSDATATQILAHNETWRAVCGGGDTD